MGRTLIQNNNDDICLHFHLDNSVFCELGEAVAHCNLITKNYCQGFEPWGNLQVKMLQTELLLQVVKDIQN